MDERRHTADQLSDPGTGDRGDDRSGPAEEFELLGLHGVGLRPDHDPRSFEEFGAVGAQLGKEGALLLRRGHTLDRGQVEHQTEHAGAFDVAEETVSEATTLAGPLDQTGDVGHHELGALIDGDHPEIGAERGEGVVGDLRFGGRDHADERALAGIGESDERDVGHEADLEFQPTLLAVLPLLGEGGGATTVREEPRVAPTTSTTGHRHPPVAVAVELGQGLAAVHVAHHGPLGHRDLQALAAPAVQVLALAVHTVGGPPVGVIAEGEQ